jgi:6-phosphofructokinase
MSAKRIGILTGGGDVPGLNSNLEVHHRKFRIRDPIQRRT